LNQTWNAIDIVNVTFDFNNGAHKTVFDPNGGNGLDPTNTLGNFMTNDLGQLRNVPFSWLDVTNVNVIFTNSSETPTA
jgi:hypothetical protein